MFKDWKKHTQSSLDLKAVRKSGNVPMGGGVNTLKVQLAPDNAYRQLYYSNEKLGSVNGVQFVELAVYVPTNAYPVNVGVVFSWNDNDLNSLDQAYLYEARFVGPTQVIYTIRKGPNPDGEILFELDYGNRFNIWHQIGLQVFFDAVGNLHMVPAYKSNGTIMFIDIDVNNDAYWTKLGEIQISRPQARLGGKVGFFVTAKRDTYQVEVDHFRVRTQRVI